MLTATKPPKKWAIWGDKYFFPCIYLLSIGCTNRFHSNPCQSNVYNPPLPTFLVRTWIATVTGQQSQSKPNDLLLSDFVRCGHVFYSIRCTVPCFLQMNFSFAHVHSCILCSFLVPERTYLNDIPLNSFSVIWCLTCWRNAFTILKKVQRHICVRQENLAGI